MLCARLYTPPEHCGDLATGETTVQLGEEQVSMLIAVAHAQGFLETRDGGCNKIALPVMRKVIHDGQVVAEWLTTDMVAGAELDPELVSPAAIVAGHAAEGAAGKNQLKQFLLTRGFSNLSTNTWRELGQKCQDQLQLEAEMATTAVNAGLAVPRLMLRDHTGQCVMSVLVKRGLRSKGEFPQGDEGITAPPASDSGWVTDLAVMSNTAAGISEETIQSFYAPLGAESDSQIRVLRRGYAHIENLRSLLYYAYHPRPMPDRPEIVATRMTVKASFKQNEYSTTVWYEIDQSSDNTIKPVKRVLKCVCGPATPGGDHCRASAASHECKYPYCTHGSANIQVLRNLPRADNVSIHVDLTSRTSKLQKWSDPGSGDTHALGEAIWKLEMCAPDRERVAPRRIVACLNTTTRAELYPLTAEDRTLNERSSHARTDARAALFEAMNRTFATELASGGLQRGRDQGMSDEDWSSSDDWDDFEESPSSAASPVASPSQLATTISAASDISLDGDDV